MATDLLCHPFNKEGSRKHGEQQVREKGMQSQVPPAPSSPLDAMFPFLDAIVLNFGYIIFLKLSKKLETKANSKCRMLK